MLEFLQNTDVSLFLYLNSLHNSQFDKIMVFISGKPEWIPLYLALIYGMFRKFGKKAWIYLGLTILVFALTDLSSVHLFKNVFQRLRPCHNPELKGLVYLVNGHCGGLYGFVSSHAANTFGLAVFMSLVFKTRWLSVGLLVWASVVSYSRIYLGVHYPFDVLGGALWGALLAGGIYYFYRRFSGMNAAGEGSRKEQSLI